jgi:intracellular sulfur oxidation DsrE/DsrF family protein
MIKARMLAVFPLAFFCFGALALAGNAGGKAEQALRIDIPVKLDKGNVVLNIDHLAKLGDMPFALGHLGLFASHFREWNIPGHIVGVFHSDAGYVMLDDKAYNADRHVDTGNPYKAVLISLMNQGVQIELCGSTAKTFGWTNADIIPGIKVNTDAMVRVTQLVQEGYVQVKE